MADLWSMELAGAAETNVGLAALSVMLADASPFWPGIVAALEGAEAGVFAAEGPGWLPLQGDYAEWKAANYPNANILELTGALRNSLTGSTSDTVYDPHATQLRWGTRVGADDSGGKSYAVYLNEGNPPLAGPRPILPIDVLAGALEAAVAGVAEMIAASWAGGAM